MKLKVDAKFGGQKEYFHLNLKIHVKQILYGQL